MKGELDWVVMKALEKDRNRRYETANGLAADIAALFARRAGAGLPAIGELQAAEVRAAEQTHGPGGVVGGAGAGGRHHRHDLGHAARDRCGGGAGCEQRGDQGRTKANQ